MQVRTRRSTRGANETDHVASVYGLAHRNIDLREVAISRGQAAAMIDIDDIAIATLPTGNRHFAGRRDFNGSSIRRIDILSFVILVAAAGKRISPATDATLEFAEDRPN